MSLKSANRLINEHSPYLLQHAYNPVDWYPWGEEAFAKARAEDKPVFLSVGYSTCHWCHVMARESFEDATAAAMLNDAFVCVKVDREERPDIDAVYMSVCQAMTGSGGWPLTIVMTPDKKPFYAATYIPKTWRYGMPGLLELVPRISGLWRGSREKLLESAKEISVFIRERADEQQAPAEPSKRLLRQGRDFFAESFDRENGGFGAAPKFPTPHNLLFLLRYYELEKDEEALAMAEKTLEQMYRGGIFDHIGGGFSRYSTDKRWLVPHFEKMLYDNALLTLAYAEAYRVTKRELYAQAARRTAVYVLRELTHAEGGFFCGQDADSDHEEGKYYVFTPGEIRHVLGPEDGARFCEWYGVDARGNFEGKSIPNLLGNSRFEHTYEMAAPLCARLYDYRIKRASLLKDDKVLVSWNGLMIAALAAAYRALGDGAYLDAAKKAADFIERRLIRPDGRLMVRWRDGHAAGAGIIDDYAFYAFGLLELYRVSLDAGYLKRAADVAGLMMEDFFDAENGGFSLYARGAEELISRPKELYDGAMPSGNAVAALVLVRLSALTGEPVWADRADRHMRFLAGNIKEYPSGHSFSLYAMAEALCPAPVLVCAAKNTPGGDTLKKLIRAEKDGVGLAVLVKTAQNGSTLESVAPFTAAYPANNGAAEYYLCKNGACLAPSKDLDALLKDL